MSNSPLEVLEYGEQIAKRAQWEAFEFTVLGEGEVEVVNGSHDNPKTTGTSSTSKVGFPRIVPVPRGNTKRARASTWSLWQFENRFLKQ